MTGAGSSAALAGGQAQPHRIPIKAVKFEFIPSEIRVVKGQPVTFVLSTPDFPHGFALPGFNLRRDPIPGNEVELTFTPDKAGKVHCERVSRSPAQSERETIST
jgi:cytochrome c oxidase subunit II